MKKKTKKSGTKAKVKKTKTVALPEIIYREVPPPATAREMLDQIDKFLTANLYNIEGNMLWDVMTALRGPDHPDLGLLKGALTIGIRRAAFPRLAKATCGHAFGSTFSPLYPFRAEALVPNLNDPIGYRHLKTHAKSAAVALGLIKP